MSDISCKLWSFYSDCVNDPFTQNRIFPGLLVCLIQAIGIYFQHKKVTNMASWMHVWVILLFCIWCNKHFNCCLVSASAVRLSWNVRSRCFKRLGYVCVHCLDRKAVATSNGSSSVSSEVEKPGPLIPEQSKPSTNVSLCGQNNMADNSVPNAKSSHVENRKEKPQKWVCCVILKKSVQ